jgi:hypothetical protein
VLCQTDRTGLHWDVIANPRVSEIGLAMHPVGGYPGTLAELWVNVAVAAALRGDEQGMRTALGRAEDALAALPGAAVPAWATATHSLAAGRTSGRGWLPVYQTIAMYPKYRGYAEKGAELATRTFADGTRKRRGLVMDRLNLAELQFRAGDRDAAVDNAQAAVDDLPGLRSARVQRKVAGVTSAAASYKGHAGADDLRARIAST